MERMERHKDDDEPGDEQRNDRPDERADTRQLITSARQLAWDAHKSAETARLITSRSGKLVERSKALLSASAPRYP